MMKRWRVSVCDKTNGDDLVTIIVIATTMQVSVEDPVSFKAMSRIVCVTSAPSLVSPAVFRAYGMTRGGRGSL